MERIKEPVSKFYRFIELLVLFVVTPALYYLDLIPIHKIIPLLILFLYCVVILLRSKPVNPKRFQVQANWTSIMVRFFVVCVVIFSWIILFTTGPILADFSSNRQLLIMTIIYPLSSAFPQELIFREFFFHRYGAILNNKTVLVATNVVLFSFAHVYFANWTVLIFTLVGGLIFALTYLKTKSLLVVTIEHTLFGVVILSSGLANQFYKAF